MARVILISVSFAEGEEKGGGHCDGHDLGGDDGEPDAVELPDEGEDKDGGDLKDEGAEEGDQCGDDAVVKSGEEGGAVDCKARKEK